MREDGRSLYLFLFVFPLLFADVLRSREIEEKYDRDGSVRSV